MSDQHSGLTVVLPETQTNGVNLINSIVAEVAERITHSDVVDYNERYIDKGPQWFEHINYHDGGQHGQTHRNKI